MTRSALLSISPMGRSYLIHLLHVTTVRTPMPGIGSHCILHEVQFLVAGHILVDNAFRNVNMSYRLRPHLDRAIATIWLGGLGLLTPLSSCLFFFCFCVDDANRGPVIPSHCSPRPMSQPWSTRCAGGSRMRTRRRPKDDKAARWPQPCARAKVKVKELGRLWRRVGDSNPR